MLLLVEDMNDPRKKPDERVGSQHPFVSSSRRRKLMHRNGEQANQKKRHQKAQTDQADPFPKFPSVVL